MSSVPASISHEPKTRTVTESRLLGLVRWGYLTADPYAAGARAGSLHFLAYQQFHICRAVQAWQLTPDAFATVWCDASRDGVHLFSDFEGAMHKFALLCHALATRPVPPNIQNRTRRQGDDDDEF